MDQENSTTQALDGGSIDFSSDDMLAEQPDTKPEPDKPKKARKKRTPTAKIDTEASRCPACGSSRRSGYYNVVHRSLSGRDMNGRAYNRITWRNCTCEDCGQVRREKSTAWFPPGSNGSQSPAEG